MTLIKLEGNKKRLVNLLEKGEKPIYEIVEYFKNLPERDGGGITRQGTCKMIYSLNPTGLVSFRDNEDGEKMVKLDKERLITKYVSDRFLPHIILLGIAMIGSIFIGMFTGLSASKWFLLGTTSMAVPVFLYVAYLIFKTSNMQDYFYDKKTDNESNSE